MAATCPVCGQGDLERFLDLPAVPVLSTEFHGDRGAALSAPTGDLQLALCRGCALVWNVAFEPALVEYTPDYENSQHFSPAFTDYVADLARRLAGRYDLAGRTVVEIGSGKGEFLAMLAATAGCTGLGFDPSFDGDVDEDRISIVRRYYDRDTATGVDAALVLARHVVEHLDDPVGFLTDVRGASGPDTPVYYEVPNAEFVFSDDGMWDLIYQHVGYFSRPTFDVALRRAGYRVTDLRPEFHGQFLGIEGRPDPGVSTAVDAAAVDAACARIETFAARLRSRLDGWRERLAGDGAGSVALWGAGAKGVAFLNLLGTSDTIEHVVDLNPRKAGRHVPGTGHRVEPPASLRGRGVTTVLVTNPAYEGEIRRELRDLGCDAEIATV